MTLFDIVGRTRSAEWNPSHVWKEFNQKREEKVMEECGIRVNDREQATRILLIALRCVQFHPDDRPSMSRVLTLLEGREKIKMLSTNPCDYFDSFIPKNSASSSSLFLNREPEGVSERKIIKHYEEKILKTPVTLEQNLEALATEMIDLKYCSSRVMRKEPNRMEGWLESIQSAMTDFIQIRREWNELKGVHFNNTLRTHDTLNWRVIESLEAALALSKGVKAIMESIETLPNEVKTDEPKVKVVTHFKKDTETSLTYLKRDKPKLDVVTPLKEVMETSDVKIDKVMHFSPAENALEMEVQKLFHKNPQEFSYEQLMAFTSNFSDSLGSGGYGDVYKGTLHNDVQVAVKVFKSNLLSDVKQDQFMAEVSILGNTRHINVVNLRGYCFEDKTKAIVYEFMENESLYKLLSGDRSIEWEMLCTIAKGTAKGLSYLHEDCEPGIIHYDIKPSNILLDSNFIPKVGGFGSAKYLDQGKTHITQSGDRGTRGYIAPEFNMENSPITHKCDVFSYGITLFDIISGKAYFLNKDGPNWFPSEVWKTFNEGHQEEFMEECCIPEKNRELAKRMFFIALRCVQYLPADRPSMSHVVRLLEGKQELKLPNDPQYVGSSSRTQTESSTSQDDEEDNISHVTLGPWGGGGNHWDDGIFAGIKTIQVFMGVKGDVRSIQVWYCGEDGKTVAGRRHGYKEAHTIDTIELDYPREYLTRVTGFYDYYDYEVKGFLLVRSLCFFTNKKQYGPYGDEWGKHFTSENNGRDGKVVGFHGRDGWYLDAIGMHMEYNKDRQEKTKMAHKEKLKENDAVNIVRIGPWGGGVNNWDDGISIGIKKIEVYKGIKGDIRSIQIWYCGKEGSPTWSKRHGSDDTHTTDTIQLDYPSEYLVRVTGFHGYEFGNKGFHLVRSLCFFSNKRKYGPFGDEKGVTFSTGDGKVVGFHGRDGRYLDAIGVHMDYSS